MYIHTEEYINPDGKRLKINYSETNPEENLNGYHLAAVHAFAFTKSGDFVLVNHPRGGWTPAGGGVDEGESIGDALYREIDEEAGMKVVHKEMIGFIDYEHNKRRHIRYFCVVEPCRVYAGDPDGDIEYVKTVHPDLCDFKKEFDWGRSGDLVLKKALKLFEEYKKNQ